MTESAMRTILLHLVLVAALACVAQPALARTAKQSVHGAIALQRDTGRFGYAYAAATSRAAKLEALKQCADPRCEVVVSFSNACGALARKPARGPKAYFAAKGATRQEAETKALRLCADRDCAITAWACTR
ncbi:MAG TPA: DUF4189 domain-containing protein [Burkholderiales bacterium]|nr:DUF4189 domain-containing protein [Burkholderiales bacterium]